MAFSLSLVFCACHLASAADRCRHTVSLTSYVHVKDFPSLLTGAFLVIYGHGLLVPASFSV